jgi:regulatory protein
MRRPAKREAPLDAEAVYEAAVRALARRARTEAELRRALARRAASAEAVETAMARLRDHGYLDDARVAESFTRFQKEVRHYGRLRVERELRARGVAAATAEAAVRRQFPAAGAAGEDALVRAYVRGKRLAPPRDAREAAKLYRRLLTAGFSAAACGRCLRAWKTDAETIERLETMQEEE